MEKYKQRKQTNNLLRVFLLTFFTFTSLFSVIGIVYSLVTVGIGSPLFLLCSIGFATCTTLSACNAYAIRNNITHRRGASQKEIACSTNKKLISLENNSKDLIDFDDQSVLNEKHNTRQYISCVPETDKEILTPKVVENVKQNNKPSLILSDKKSPTNQNLKSPSIPQTHGTSFGAINCHVNRMTNQNSPAFHQSQKNSTLPISRVIVADKPKALSQSQNINNPSKSTVPIPPPMSIAASEISSSDKLSTISQFQAAEQNNPNKQDGIDSEFQAPPPPPPMPITAAPEVSLSDEPSTISQVTEQNNSNEQDDIEHHKEEIDQQPNSVASEFQTLPLQHTNRSKFLEEIRKTDQTKLKYVDESEKNKCSKSDNRNNLLEDIRKNKKLRRFTDEEIRRRFKVLKNDRSLNLENQLKTRAKAMGHSDDESDSSTPSLDWEDSDAETFPEAQEESNNKSSEDYVEGSNHHVDSGISDDESSPERNNISKDIQLKNSLPHSPSNNDIKGSVEQPQGPLSCSSSCPSFTENLSY